MRNGKSIRSSTNVEFITVEELSKWLKIALSKKGI